MAEKLVYTSPIAFDGSHQHTLVMTCSDPRFLIHTIDFLNNHLGLHKFDSIIVPGGPAAACLSSSIFFAVRPQIKMLNDLHGFKQIIGFFHDHCGYYEKKYPQIGADRFIMRDLQRSDAQEFFKLLRGLLPGMKTECYSMRIIEDQEEKRVEFVQFEKG